MSPNSRQAVRSAAITGAGSGLGRDIALGLAEKGYTVFGTALTEAEDSQGVNPADFDHLRPGNALGWV